ncbi:hypothetical protein KCU71_g6177, partial [Aureobasidium melanogenum]
MSKEPKIVVGVDFGTTYSGLSYAYSAAPNPYDITVIKEWPIDQSVPTVGDLWKVPTEIAYRGAETPLWGYQIPPAMPRYTRFKLGLDADTPPTRFDHPGSQEALQLPPGKKPSDVCADFLRLLYQHLMNILQDRLGAFLDLDTMPIHFNMTVPTNWSERAMALTKAAAKEAGLGSRTQDELHMIKEPTAAATWTLSYIERVYRPQHSMLNENILVCDAGGGTVDLVTCTINKLRPLVVSEAVANQGGKCGSTSIDSDYLYFVRDQLNVRSSDQNALEIRRGSQLMVEFTSYKNTFGSPSTPDRVSLRTGRGEEFVRLDRAQTTELFAPTLERVRALIEQQVRECANKRLKVHRILLVGGFGSSRYVEQNLRRWVNEAPLQHMLGENLIITQPPFAYITPWTATVQGAALHGIQSIVVTRVLDKHYGYVASDFYDESVHASWPAKDIYFSPFHGHKMAGNAIQWFATKGHRIDDDTEFTTKTFSYENADKLQLKLVTCLEENPPQHVEHPSVQTLGHIELSLADAKIPDSECEKIRVPGWWGTPLGSFNIYRIVFSVHAKMGNGELRFRTTTAAGTDITLTSSTRLVVDEQIVW